MIKDKSIYIKNIYYMLSYAFQILKQSNYDEVASEKFDNAQDLFAAILSKGIGQQLKQGLYREYVTKNENLSEMCIRDRYALLATDGMLVKRPVLVGDGFVLTGFKESTWAEALGIK